MEENYNPDSHFSPFGDEVRPSFAGLQADIYVPSKVVNNPCITAERNVDTIDPATLVGLKFRSDEKDALVRMNSCQFPESILSRRRRQQGDRSRYCYPRNKFSFTVTNQDADGSPTL